MGCVMTLTRYSIHTHIYTQDESLTGADARMQVRREAALASQGATDDARRAGADDHDVVLEPDKAERAFVLTWLLAQRPSMCVSGGAPLVAEVTETERYHKKDPAAAAKFIPKREGGNLDGPSRSSGDTYSACAFLSCMAGHCILICMFVCR